MSPAAVAPFPFAALEALGRREAEASAHLRRLAARAARKGALARALAETTGEEVRFLVRRVRPHDPRRLLSAGVAVAIEVGGEATILVEAETALAVHLAARALQRPPPRLVDPSREPSSPLVGAFAAVALSCLRRAHAGASFRVREAGSPSALLRALVERAPRATTVDLTVVAADEAFAASVTVPDASGLGLTPRPFDREDLERLGEVPVALPLVSATCASTSREIGELEIGDVFVAPSLSLEEASLVPPRGERGIGLTLAEGGHLVVRELSESHPWDREEPRMSADASSRTTAEVLEDAPLLVRIELGVVEMTAREWAALAPGDVVALGRKIGEPAILRVGGVEVARGELVQVDGEYGVRVLGRPGGG